MGAAATGTPLIPSGYVAGTITISAGQAGSPQNLFDLIRAQLDPNCVGVGREINIQNDFASGTLYIGGPNPILGALSTSNYGYALVPGAARTYRSSFPGNAASVGDLQVLLAATGTFHVEVT